MLEISEEIPFLWRLSSDNEEGFSQVSMVVPFNSGDENLEHTIRTDIISFNSDADVHESEETLEWNDEDISLFLKLLSAKNAHQVNDQTHTFRVDLSDPETIEIVNIVAAAGFGMALNVDDLLITDPGDTQSLQDEPEVGTHVTLHTVDGYKRGIVVGSDEDEVVCVLQDPIRPDKQCDLSDIHPHDLVIVKSHQLLPAHYSSQVPTTSDVLH